MNKTTFHGEISIFTYFHYEITIFFNVKPFKRTFHSSFRFRWSTWSTPPGKNTRPSPRSSAQPEATEAMKIDQRGIETWKFYMVLPYLTVLLAISSTKSQQLSLGTCSVLGPCHLIHKGMFYKSFMAGWWFGTWLLFFHILGIILPIDELIFFKMVKTTNHLWEYLPSGNLT